MAAAGRWTILDLLRLDDDDDVTEGRHCVGVLCRADKGLGVCECVCVGRGEGRIMGLPIDRL